MTGDAALPPPLGSSVAWDSTCPGGVRSTHKDRIQLEEKRGAGGGQRGEPSHQIASVISVEEGGEECWLEAS